jgi:hypothetical protein
VVAAQNLQIATEKRDRYIELANEANEVCAAQQSILTALDAIGLAPVEDDKFKTFGEG